MDCSPPGSSVNGILQAIILESVVVKLFNHFYFNGLKRILCFNLHSTNFSDVEYLSMYLLVFCFL